MENAKIESSSNVESNIRDTPSLLDSSSSKKAIKELSKDIARALPNNTDAEKGVLSAMLQSPDEIATDAVQVLAPNAFYVPSHKILYELIIKLTDEGKPIDAITLQEALIRENLLDKVGGPSAVIDLIDFVPDASHFEYYVDIVKEKHLLREIISTCTTC
ncbi:MAG: DnaB-like helicase N-terminal domain-containing protein, partial [Verrucomicrobiota bacterium]|nr:DnaB-like helicase N-terminal domain-containing protein [Verrucomicrobiota bacterium]